MSHWIIRHSEATIILGLLSVVFGLPAGYYFAGYRPPPCCTQDNGVIYRIIEREQRTLFSAYPVWDLYYNATSTYQPYSYSAFVTVQCQYYTVGTHIQLNRNIQKPMAINPFGVVANGTNFSTLQNAPNGC